jgi:alpha-tubulin suppressor-like RCC1 family protein
MRFKIFMFLVVLTLFIFVNGYASYAIPSKIIAISAGPSHCLALGEDGSVWEWGDNSVGELNGVKEDYPHSMPMQVPITNVKAISAGMFQNLALKNDGTIWAWGESVDGNLGNFSGNGTFNPIQIPITNISAIYAGKAWNFVIKNDGTVWAWGANYYGQLGDGAYENSVNPVQIELSNVDYIDGNGCFALKNGTIWAWGDNVYDTVGSRQVFTGALGDNSPNTTRSIPFEVKGFSDIIGISHGESHTLVLNGNGTVWAWGKDNKGQLGDGRVIGMFEYQNTPIVTKIDNVKAVSAGGSQSMALKNDGTVWTWGAIEGYSGSTNPQKVNGLSNIIMISAGADHCMALKDDGTIWEWGLNDKGQAGDSTNDAVVSTPVEVKINFNSTINNSPTAITNTIGAGHTASPTPNGIANESVTTAEAPSQDNGLIYKLLGAAGLIILVGGILYLAYRNKR